MSTTTTRSEHMQWCKDRAVEYLDAGYWQQAVASMASDLSKHTETEGHIGIPLMLTVINERTARDWVEGFN